MPEVGQLLSLEYGAALPAERRAGHGFPVFGSNGEVGRHDQTLVDGPGIVVGRKGSVGKVCWSEDSFWPIDTTYWVKCAAEQRRWVYWLLSRLPLGELDSSTGVPGLNRNDVYELNVFEPPTADEKSKIAEILDALDTNIRQTEAIIDKLKQVKQGLLRVLLTRGIDPNGELRPPQSQAPHLYRDSPLGWIPESWSVLSLDELVAAPICYGIVQVFSFVPDGVPVLAIKDLLGDYVSGVHRTAKSIDAAYSRSRVKPGDVLVSIKGTIGRVGVVPGHYEGNISRDMARLRPGPLVRTGYFAQLLRSQAGQQILALAQVGTTRAELSIAPLRKLRFAVPEPREQALVEEALFVLDQRVAAEEAILLKMRAKKIGLMDDLLTGRVRVTPLLKATAPT